MPTTEWMNRYETIKDKLACKTDLEAYFTQKTIGTMGVDVLDIGAVHFPTGTIFACDPMVELEDTLPFIQTIPAGTYPVKICVVPSKRYGDRYACVKVEVNQRGAGRGTEGRRLFWLWRGCRDGLCGRHPDPGSFQDLLGQTDGGRPGHRPLQRPVLRPSGRKRQSPSQISIELWRLAQLDGTGHRLQSAHLRLRLG